MLKKLTLTLALLLMLGMAAGADAQSTAGEQELGFLASYFKSMDSNANDDGIIVANVRYGRYITPALQLGGGIQLFGDIGNLDANGRFELFGAYYFDPEEVNTFYTRAGYFAPWDDPGEGFIDGAFGYKSYFNESTAFFWEGAYGHPIGDADDGVIRSVAGLSFLF